MKLAPGRHTVEAVPPKDKKGPVAATIAVDKPPRNVRASETCSPYIGPRLAARRKLRQAKSSR